MCFYQNLDLIAEYYVDCLHTLQWRLLWRILVTEIDRKSKQVKNSHTENFNCNQYWEQLTILNTKNIILFAFSYTSAEYLQKIWIFNFSR